MKGIAECSPVFTSKTLKKGGKPQAGFGPSHTNVIILLHGPPALI